MPDIKTIELIYEMSKDKIAQLESFVNCAEIWRFPIAGTQCELGWNDKVESKQWSDPLVENWRIRTSTWHARNIELDVQIIRFTRK